MKHLCVYCGSKPGNDPSYAEGARALGRAMCARDIGLVYGAGSVGMMTLVADEVLDHGGTVLGIIPQALVNLEVSHQGLTETIVTHTMHERKAIMEARSDGFVAMPGGLGTLDELFEIWTWLQLGVHRKPVGMLNISGYFDALLTFLDHMVTQGYLSPMHRDLLLVDTDPEALLDRMTAWSPPDGMMQWITAEQT